MPPAPSEAAEGGGRSPTLDPSPEKRESNVGAPRIHGELLILSFEICEPIVSRYLRCLKRIPEDSKASQWPAFLNNCREVIAAFDFFTVPTLSFRTLYCFFASEHDRRRILHFQRYLPSNKRLDRAATAGSEFPRTTDVRTCISKQIEFALVCYSCSSHVDPPRCQYWHSRRIPAR